jgi:hypothetical protein
MKRRRRSLSRDLPLELGEGQQNIEGQSPMLLVVLKDWVTETARAMAIHARHLCREPGDAPPGLPYGDKAVLAQVKGNTGGLVFLIDRNKVCTLMPIPHELLAMMHDVATETINHETGGLVTGRAGSFEIFYVNEMQLAGCAKNLRQAIPVRPNPF